MTSAFDERSAGLTTIERNSNTDVVLAAGGVLYRNTDADGDEILLVHRRRYNDWTLPKGKLKPGESFQAAALREVAEETGCSARLENYLGAFGYAVNGIPKTILLWRMSLIAQTAIGEQEEVSDVLWMTVSAAIERLTHPDEKAFVFRASNGLRTYASPEPLGNVTQGGLRGPRNWFWAKRHDYARLQRELECFRVELALLEAQNQQPDKAWAAAAHDQLRNVTKFLETRDVEGGWVCLHAARRLAVHGLGVADIQTQASILLAESTKFSSWRAKEMQNLLRAENAPLTAAHVINAMALRDEYFSNQYHKIWIMGHQLAILLITAGLGSFLLIPLTAFYSRSSDATLAPWGYEMVTAVLFFGLLGAAFSAAGSLINAGVDVKIPERVMNQFVTTARALFGAGTALAGYAFYQSKVLDVRIGGDDGPSGALGVAFLFGFAGEQLVSHVLGTFAARKS